MAYSLGNAYLDALRYGSTWGYEGFTPLHGMVKRVNALYDDWAFAVQVAAKRQGVKIPFDIVQNE
jgi:hypothetical protein